MAADAAIGGREAITIAPALPAHGPMPARPRWPDTGADETASALAALGAVLNDRLARAAMEAATPGDQNACAQAAEAGRRIRDLMARDHDASGVR